MGILKTKYIHTFVRFTINIMNEKKEEGIGRTKNILFHIYRMFRKGDNIEDSEGGGTKLRYFDV